MRITKATLIYKRTKNLRAVQRLLGHSKLESTVCYLGIEVDDALEISEQTEIWLERSGCASVFSVWPLFGIMLYAGSRLRAAPWICSSEADVDLQKLYGI